MGALQTEFGHLHGFDTLDVFVASGDAGNKGIETLDHRKSLRFMVSGKVYHMKVEMSTRRFPKSWENAEKSVKRTRTPRENSRGVVWNYRI